VVWKIDAGIAVLERPEGLWQATLIFKVVTHDSLFTGLGVVEDLAGKLERRMESDVNEIPETPLTIVFEVNAAQVLARDSQNW
jgi:hypothetical protein